MLEEKPPRVWNRSRRWQRTCWGPPRQWCGAWAGSAGLALATVTQRMPSRSLPSEAFSRIVTGLGRAVCVAECCQRIATVVVSVAGVAGLILVITSPRGKNYLRSEEGSLSPSVQNACGVGEGEGHTMVAEPNSRDRNSGRLVADASAVSEDVPLEPENKFRKRKIRINSKYFF